MKKKVIGILAGVLAVAASAGVGLYAYSHEEIKTDTIAVSEFTELTVKATSADIRVKQGSRNEISYQLPETLVPEIKEDGGKLTVISKSSRKFPFFNISFGSKKTYIEITLTEDALKHAEINVTSGDISLSGIDFAGSINSTSGDIRISDSESGENLSIDATSGDLFIENCVFGKLECEQTSGDIQLKNVTADSYSGHTTSGDFSGSGLDAQNISIKATSGDIEMSVAGKESDYDCDLSCTSGDITVSGKEQGNRHQVQLGAERSVSVKTTSGDISICFAQCPPIIPTGPDSPSRGLCFSRKSSRQPRRTACCCITGLYRAKLSQWRAPEVHNLRLRGGRQC
ncbi:MAG: DUF4097 domain-containing protein [Oscillospiraceae bacterium]|nr:DUF4097 domain-containing protein [Oscillospiraceae bacterium]